MDLLHVETKEAYWWNKNKKKFNYLRFIMSLDNMLLFFISRINASLLPILTTNYEFRRIVQHVMLKYQRANPFKSKSFGKVVWRLCSMIFGETLRNPKWYQIRSMKLRNDHHMMMNYLNFVAKDRFDEWMSHAWDF